MNLSHPSPIVPLHRSTLFAAIAALLLAMPVMPVIAVADDANAQVKANKEGNADKAPKADKQQPVPLDAVAPDDLNQVNDPPGRVKPLAKRPVNTRLQLMSTVAREIATQGKKEWLRDRAFRRYADYSSQVKFGLTNRQIIQALGKRQDSHPALDAYIRWQLLSFAPDLNELKEIELKRLTANLPPLTRLPPPPKPGNILQGNNGARGYFFSGTQRAFLSDLKPVPGTGLANPTLSVVNSGAGISAAAFDPAKAIETARNETYDYVKAAAAVEYLNGPAIHFRDAFVRMVPETEGLRLQVMYQDLEDRIKAGDPGYKDAAQLFYNEAQRTRNDTTIPDRTRAMLIHKMRDLARERTTVVREIKIDDAGNLRVQQDVIQFPKKFVAPLLTNLKGGDR